MMSGEQILAISLISGFSAFMIIICYKCINEHSRKLKEKNRLKIVKKLSYSNKIKPFKIDEIYNVNIV